MGRYSSSFKGFTLIEVVIGIGIFALVLSAMLSGLISFTSLAEMARSKTVAVNDAKQVMEQTHDTLFSTVTSVDWTSWASNNGCNTLGNERVNVAFTYPEPPATDLLQITTTVTWQVKNRPMSISLVTLRTRT
jgi:prepilin-type N-terminal cleavage/methylation domain-containing protein